MLHNKTYRGGRKKPRSASLLKPVLLLISLVWLVVVIFVGFKTHLLGNHGKTETEETREHMKRDAVRESRPQYTKSAKEKLTNEEDDPSKDGEEEKLKEKETTDKASEKSSEKSSKKKAKTAVLNADDHESTDRKRPRRYITYECFPGRLNNQLWTLDWAFRASKAFERTLIYSSPKKRECWIGIPENKEEEQHSLWDMEKLHGAFDMIIEADLTDDLPKGRDVLSSLILEIVFLFCVLSTEASLPPSQLDKRCVWSDMPKDGNLLSF